MPAQATFDFETREEFEKKAGAAILGWADRLAGKTFHIRLHRRGLGDQLSRSRRRSCSTQHCSTGSSRWGTPGRIDFSDPDYVIDIETVGNRAGLSLWAREDLRRYPFLRVD